MQLNITAIIATLPKFKRAMELASKGKGHLMNGHNRRCYIHNRHGHGIARVDYRPGKGFTIWGNGSVDITATVRKAFLRSALESRHA